VVAGHIWMAMRDPEARLGMRTGHVSPEWARRHHPQWRHDAHLTDPAPASDPGTGTHKSSSSLRPPVPPR
jgi:formate dehydrogenase subunit gamma